MRSLDGLARDRMGGEYVRGGGLGGGAPVAAEGLGERLRRWLRGAAVASNALDERDYLPEVATDRVQAAAGGADPDGGMAEFAIALLTVARDGDPAMREAVLDALGTAKARWWLAVDWALRQRWWSAPRWSRSIAASLAGDELDALRLVVAACHHDGRIREAAVVRLAGRAYPAAVAVLALRSSDWVAEVRQSARTVVEAWPSLPDGPALTTLVEMSFALGGRREGGWLARRVEEGLRGLPAQWLEPLLTARDRRVRRTAYRTAIAAGGLGQDRLMAAAVRDGDLPIRTMCAQAAVREADSAQLRRLLASRTAVVRAEALQALIVGGDVDVVESALFDRHPLVRAVAQAAVRGASSDPGVHYRRFAVREVPEPGTLAGLGETGGPDDADVVARWLSHPRARGRVEAVRALRRVGVVRPGELMPLLGDESAAVTRQAVLTLRRDAGAVDLAVLEALLRRGNATHVRFAGYRLLTAGDAWQRLVVNLRLIDDPDDRLRASARADLTAWLDREAATTYHAPSNARGAELDVLIEQARLVLGERKVRLLRFHAGLNAAG